MDERKKTDHDIIEEDLKYYRTGKMINTSRDTITEWSRKSREYHPFGQSFNVGRIHLDNTVLRPNDPHVFKNYILNLRDLWVQGIFGETNLVHKFGNLLRLWIMGYLPIAVIYTIGFLIPQWVMSTYCEADLYWETLNNIVYAPMYGGITLLLLLMSPILSPLFPALLNEVNIQVTSGITIEDIRAGGTVVGLSLMGGYAIYWFAKRLYKSITIRHPQWRHEDPDKTYLYNLRQEHKAEESREQEMRERYQEELSRILHKEKRSCQTED